MTVLLDEFKTYLLENEKSENTISSYISDVKQFLVVASDEITTESIKAYTCQLQDKDMAIKTINRKLVSIKQYIEFLNECKEEKIIVKVRQLKQQSQNYLDDMLTEKDFASLIKSTEKHNDMRAKAIFCTLGYTGLRVSEMLQLQVSDVKHDSINICGKGGKHREVFVSSKLKKVWKEYLAVRANTAGAALFTGERGAINRQTVDSIIKYHAGQIRLKKTKAHAHNLRHLFCKTAIDRGLTIDVVADLAGHGDINTTRIYTRKSKKELLAAIETL